MLKAHDVAYQWLAMGAVALPELGQPVYLPRRYTWGGFGLVFVWFLGGGGGAFWVCGDLWFFRYCTSLGLVGCPVGRARMRLEERGKKETINGRKGENRRE